MGGGCTCMGLARALAPPPLDFFLKCNAFSLSVLNHAPPWHAAMKVPAFQNTIRVSVWLVLIAYEKSHRANTVTYDVRPYCHVTSLQRRFSVMFSPTTYTHTHTLCIKVHTCTYCNVLRYKNGRAIPAHRRWSTGHRKTPKQQLRRGL